MSEAVFPLLGPLLVFAVVLPLSAACTKLVLGVLDRFDHSVELHVRQGTRYLLLVASSAVPLAWFFSASLHQAETGRSSVCAVGHASGAFCPEAAYFALALVACAALFALPRLLREQAARPASAIGTAPALRGALSGGTAPALRGGAVSGGTAPALGGGAISANARSAAARVMALIAARPGLAALAGRVDVRDDLPVAIVTLGIARPRVVARSSFLEALDDEALAGALHHELEHVSSRDPLRYLVAWWALAVNPIGRFLLDRELARWLLAREVHCDRDAVLEGADAPALAQAIVTAARPIVSRSGTAPALRGGASALLGAVDAAALRLRVNLLLAYTERAPERCCRRPTLRFAGCMLAVVLLLPHGGGTHALDFVHATTERAVALITRP